MLLDISQYSAASKQRELRLETTHTHTLSTENHTNVHDTSSDPLTTIVANHAVSLSNAFRICHSLNAYSSGTHAKRHSSDDRWHCIYCISMPTILGESQDCPLRDTQRFASYQRLVCERESTRRHSTHIISSTSALLNKATNVRRSCPCTNTEEQLGWQKAKIFRSMTLNALHFSSD